MCMAPSDYSQIKDLREKELCLVFVHCLHVFWVSFFPVVLALSLMPLSFTDTRSQLLLNFDMNQKLTALQKFPRSLALG